MKRIKRILSMLLVITMICVTGLLPIGAGAATAQQELEARGMFELGLFKGYDTTGTNFGLDDKVSREHALTFMIRLLGEDAAALAWKGASPYTDVPANSWALPYIGYAKAKGYTVGMGDNKFGLGREANMKEMTIFSLRGLGYSDSSSVNDFSWNTVLDFATSKGVLPSATIVTPFTRGVAADIMMNTLAAKVKGQEYDLLSKLLNTGVVTQAQYDKALAVMKGTTPPVPTDTKEASQKAVARYDAAIARYNTLIDRFNKLGLGSDKELLKVINELSSQIDQVSQVIGDGTPVLTADQLTSLNAFLDSLDAVMKDLDALIKAAS